MLDSFRCAKDCKHLSEARDEWAVVKVKPNSTFKDSPTKNLNAFVVRLRIDVTRISISMGAANSLKALLYYSSQELPKHLSSDANFLTFSYPIFIRFYLSF